VDAMRLWPGFGGGLNNGTKDAERLQTGLPPPLAQAPRGLLRAVTCHKRVLALGRGGGLSDRQTDRVRLVLSCFVLFWLVL